MRRFVVLVVAAIVCFLALPVLAQEAAAPAVQGLGEQFMREVVPQLIAVLGSALLLLVVWLRSKAAKGIAEAKMGDAAKAALGYASNLAFELVLAAFQTTAEGLKAKLADGRLSREEYEAQMSELKRAVLAKLQEATVGRLLSSGAVASTGAAAALASDLVEAAVVKSKAVVANPPAPPQG